MATAEAHNYWKDAERPQSVEARARMMLERAHWAATAFSAFDRERTMRVETGKVREFARAVKDPNPAYRDEARAIAPPTFLMTMALWLGDLGQTRAQGGGGVGAQGRSARSRSGRRTNARRGMRRAATGARGRAWRRDPTASGSAATVLA